MDSTTSHHHDASDDHDEHDDAAGTIEELDRLAGAIGEARVVGTAVLLTGTHRPPRAIPGNPPRSAQKKGETGRSGPDRDEKR